LFSSTFVVGLKSIKKTNANQSIVKKIKIAKKNLFTDFIFSFKNRYLSLISLVIIKIHQTMDKKAM
jgi:hypothetical protein